MIRTAIINPALSAVANVLGRTVCANTLTILTYHRVLAEPDPLCPSEPTAGVFSWQMALIQRYFNVLRLDEALIRLEDKCLPRNALCVTFDDGYRDNFHNALPILEEHGIPATFFIATDFLDGGIMWNDSIIESIRSCLLDKLDLRAFGLGEYPIIHNTQRRTIIQSIISSWKYLPQIERGDNVRKLIDMLNIALPGDFMMSSAEVVKLHKRGMEIGGHTMSHPILARENTDRAFAEIARGKEQLEELIKAPLKFFAYPNGKWGKDYTQEHIGLVRRAGFIGAVSTDAGVSRPSDDMYRLRRVSPWEHRPERFYFRLVQNLLA